ncbi:MAG: hypothetical protein KJ558_10005 [Gammaproteobacteria bacterium]|nr:hypothetical protein [Gammaproteobacteria bacterium]MBU1959681.1 hypothetical protein [Gammaproteobacteria bacterium]
MGGNALQDQVANTLDNLAVLAAHWARQREQGQNPKEIRQAMLMVARAALAYAEASDREVEREMSERFGQAASAEVTDAASGGKQSRNRPRKTASGELR